MKYMRVEVYVPIPYTEEGCSASTDLHRRLRELAGGITAVLGQGEFTSRTGAIQDEEVGIFTLFIEDTDINRDIVESLCITYKEEAEQESVLYVINANEVRFI